MKIKDKILKKAYRFDTENGDKVYNLFDILNYMNSYKKLNYWDAKGYDGDFDRWCDSKNYPKLDPEGKKRSQSNIWFAEQQKEIKEGLWDKPQYCCFIDVFVDILNTTMLIDEYLRGDEYEELDLEYLVKYSKEKDIQEYKKEDYRTKLATELKDMFGPILYVTAAE